MNDILLPRRPYLFKAIYDWLLDNQLTPFLVVDTSKEGVRVPQQFIRDNQIVLNLASSATANLSISNDEVRFNARFGGVPHVVVAPMRAILALYARENGVGMMFEDELFYDEESQIRSKTTASERGIHLVTEECENSEQEAEEKVVEFTAPKKKPIFTVVD